MCEFHKDDAPPHSRKIGNIDARFGSAAWQIAEDETKADIRKRGYAQGLEEGKKLAKAEAERWTVWDYIVLLFVGSFVAEWFALFCKVWL